MELTAFKLNPEYTLDELQGATMSYGPHAHMFDIKAELVAGNGTIVTDDALLASTLAGNPLLQACDAPAGAALAMPPGRENEPTPEPVLYVPQQPLVGDPASLAGPSVADEAPAPEVPEPEPESEPEPEGTTTDEERGWQ